MQTSPSCVVPKTFRTFRAHARGVSTQGLAAQSFGQVPAVSSSAEETEQLFVTDGVISLKRAALLFTGGFALAFAGRKILQSAFRESGKAVESKSLPHDESQTYLFFQKPLSSLFQLVLEEPKLLKTLAIYAVAGTGGYVSSSLFQGLQETWVRREETKIRSDLLTRMSKAFQQSIRIKQDEDQVLKERAKVDIRRMLQRHGIQGIEALLSERGIVESEDVLRRYFYEPTHRTVNSGKLNFGQYLSADDPQEYHQPPLIQGLDVLFAGAGLMTGLVIQGIGQAFKSFRVVLGKHEEKLQEGTTKMMTKSVGLYDLEALMVLSQKLNNRMLILGYGLMVGLAGAGKLLIDGLREIEVTRVNAATEYRYQKHNWTVLDPTFHGIAEQEAVTADLKRLEEDLGYLQYQPQLLKSRIDAILNNIGRNSAPKYFPMTPPVGLVVARS